MMACTCWTELMGLSRSVSRVPGAAPRTSTPATAPASQSTAVHPVGRCWEVKWPTLMPRTSVRLRLDELIGSVSVVGTGFCALAVAPAAIISATKDCVNSLRCIRIAASYWLLASRARSQQLGTLGLITRSPDHPIARSFNDPATRSPDSPQCYQADNYAGGHDSNGL